MLRAIRSRIIFAALMGVCLATLAQAQLGVRGQIFLPNGSPVQRPTRFTLTTDNGTRTDYFYTDSNGRIAMPRITARYTITVEGDGQLFDTTSVSFDPQHAGNYIIINLQPLKLASSGAPGLIDATAVDQKVDPKAKEAYESAVKMIQAGQYEQAVEPLKRAISTQPDYFHAYNDLGVLYMKLKQLDEAAEAFGRAIKINGKVYHPQLNLGIVLNRQGKHKEAADLLGKLQQTHPELWQINGPLIEALVGASEWPQAEEAINRAIGFKQADTVDLRNKLGMVMMRQGKFEAAAAALRGAVGDEPANALAQFNLGAALLQVGNLTEAETALRRAYEIEGARVAGAQLLLGQLYFQKKNYAAAIEAFETYLRDLPTAPNEAQVKEAISKLREALRK